MHYQNLKPAIIAELQRARAARSSGNEGMARVCARRAAGHAIRGYFQDKQIPVLDPSAINLIRHLKDVEGLPVKVLAAAEDLLARVDTHYQLPEEMDLIAAAEIIVSALYPLDLHQGGNHEC